MLLRYVFGGNCEEELPETPGSILSVNCRLTVDCGTLIRIVSPS